MMVAGRAARGWAPYTVPPTLAGEGVIAVGLAPPRASCAGSIVDPRVASLGARACAGFVRPREYAPQADGLGHERPPVLAAQVPCRRWAHPPCPRAYERVLAVMVEMVRAVARAQLAMPAVPAGAAQGARDAAPA